MNIIVLLMIVALIDIYRRSFASWIHADRRRSHWRAWGIGITVVFAVGVNSVGVIMVVLPIIFLVCYVGLLLPAMQRGRLASIDFRDPTP